VSRYFCCNGCGHPYPAPRGRGRCPACAKTYERDKSRRRRRTPKERQRRQDLIAAHVRVHGWTCPGFEREPHPSTDLTADHLMPVARGGNEEGELRVLCRSCNSSRGAGVASPRSGRPEPPRPRFSRKKLRDSDAGQNEIDNEPLVA
jgi:hypothetical protein